MIIDNKAYSKGYNLPINQAFDAKVINFNYLFVSLSFVGGFKRSLQLIADRTGVNGGAIDVENLLYLAEEIKSGRLKYEDSFNEYRNDEIKINKSINFLVGAGASVPLYPSLSFGKDYPTFEEVVSDKKVTEQAKGFMYIFYFMNWIKPMSEMLNSCKRDGTYGEELGMRTKSWTK